MQHPLPEQHERLLHSTQDALGDIALLGFQRVRKAPAFMAEDQPVPLPAFFDECHDDALP